MSDVASRTRDQSNIMEPVLTVVRHRKVPVRTGSFLFTEADAMGRRLSTAEFIEKAKAKHGDKYSYSNVEYVNSKEKVCITCKVHGDFWQRPGDHSNGNGCPKCYIESHEKTTEQFIGEAESIHGSKYGYSKVEYVSHRSEVCIICPVHGEFWQRPDVHLRGNGCRQCSNDSLVKTTQQFISEAEEVHDGKYDYSKARYRRGNEKVCIICPDHDEFWQTPGSHLRGSGCPECGRVSRSEKRMGSTESFIEKAISVHGDRYNYSNVEYSNNSTNVCIICPEHREFWQQPSNHLMGKGCPKCGDILGAKKRIASSGQSFIEKARSVHGGKYGYSKVEYVNSKEKVCITCKVHGDFWQSPTNHLNGQGCPKCVGKSMGEASVRATLEHREIDYIAQYSHDSLRSESGRVLRFDFYVPSWNTLIEYDGRQHFRPVDRFGGEEGFRRTVKRDYAKNRWAIDNVYNLVRIPYWLLDDVDSIIQRLADANQSNSCSADDASHLFQLMLFESPGDKE